MPRFLLDLCSRVCRMIPSQFIHRIVLPLLIIIPFACPYPNSTNVGVDPNVVPTLNPAVSLDALSTLSDIVVENVLYVNDSGTLYGNNITFRNCRFIYNQSAVGFVGLLVFEGVGIVIEKCDFINRGDLGAPLEIAVISNNDNNCATIVDSKLIGFRDGILTSPCAYIRNNYIANSNLTNGSSDGIWIRPHSGPVVVWTIIEDNTVLTPAGSNSAIFLDTPSQNTIIRRNLLGGGGYTLYLGSNGTNSSSYVQVYENAFTVIYYPNSGYYGPAAYAGNGLGNLWENNTWFDGPNANQILLDSDVDPFSSVYNVPCPSLSGTLPSGLHAVCVNGTYQTFGNSQGQLEASLTRFCEVFVGIPISVNGDLNITAPTSLTALTSVSGNLTITAIVSLSMNASISVGGSLTLNSGLTIDGDSQKPPLVVGGCVEFNGTLTISLNATTPPPNLTLARFGCATGGFTDVNVVNPQCDLVAQVDYAPSVVTVIFSFRPDGVCAGLHSAAPYYSRLSAFAILCSLRLFLARFWTS